MVISQTINFQFHPQNLGRMCDSLGFSTSLHLTDGSVHMQEDVEIIKSELHNPRSLSISLINRMATVTST